MPKIQGEDNVCKLGYGGTKEEMQRLIDDANKVKTANGEMADLSIDSFADVTEAIHIMQNEMGITGTTSREAASTIEGSLSMMKAAWENLVVGMADEEQDFDKLVNNFVESAAIAAENLIPRIEVTLEGIGLLIEKMAPIIADALPKVVESLLPTIITSGITLITALANAIVTALPAVKTALEEGLVIILTDVFGVSEEKARGFVDGLNSAFTAIADGFRAMVESAQTDGTFLNSIWEGLKGTGQAFCDLLVGLWDVLSAAFTWCVEQINTDGTILNSIWETITTVITSAIDIIKNVIKLFAAVFNDDWNGLWEAAKGILSAAWDVIKSAVKTALNIIGSLISGAIQLITYPFRSIWDSCKTIVSAAWDAIKSKVSGAIDNVKSTISTGMDNAKKSVSDVLDGIKKKFTDIWDNCKKIVSDAVTALKNALNFSWSLPKLKLPHISVTGGVAPYGIGGKGSLPKFNIEWYKKAYDNAMILNSPTIFGYSAASGKFLGGGDGNGNEIVAGESYLMNLIGNVVAERNGQLVELLAALLEATVDGNSEMVRALKAGQVITLNERELGRAVRGLA